MEVMTMPQFDLFDNTQNHVLDAPNYEQFKAQLAASGCQACALSASRTHIVVDRGNPASDVLMIGEGPGENEDLQGKAFVGRAGQLLDKLLLELGFDTNRDSLIINVVKCRPPGNRAPKQEEADACSGFLRRQLSLVSPKVILLLGATALKHMIPARAKTRMVNAAGQLFDADEFPGVKIMVLYHPAYILRDPRKKTVMIEHLNRFLSYLRGQTV
jgi:uracil-DNA glycosylase